MSEYGTKRGNPMPWELVHSIVPRNGVHDAHALCNTGAYNIRWTECVRNVTCPVCKERLGGRIPKK